MVFDVTGQLSQLILSHEIRDRQVTLLGMTVFEKRSQVPSLSSSVGQRGPWGADPANRAMHPYVISNKVMNVEGDHFFLHGF